MEIESNIASCVRSYLSDLGSAADDHVVEWLAGECSTYLRYLQAEMFMVVAESFLQVS